MINLLPQENRKHLKASQLNTVLLKYVFFFASTLIALTVSIGFIYLNLFYTKISIDKNLEDARGRAQTIAKSKQEASELQTQIQNIDKIYNQQIHYSKVLTALAQQLPDDVIIDAFHIGSNAFSKPQTIQIHAQNHDKVIETKRALEKATFIAGVAINNVNTDQKNNVVSGTLTVSFNKQGLGELLQWRKK